MKLFRRSSLLSLALTLAFVLPLSPFNVWLGAQQAAPAQQPALSVAATPPSGGAKRAMDIEDVIAFRNMGLTSLSPDGQWVVYSMRPTQGDSEVIVRSTASEKEMKFPVGDGGGGSAIFSEDSQWIAISTSAKKADADAARRASRPAAQAGMMIVNLATGEKKDIAKIRRFVFNGEMGGWIALHRFGPDAAAGAGPAAAAAPGGGRPGGPGRGGAGAGTAGDTRAKGTDLVLHELKTGNQINIGNVSEFSFNKPGKTLAMVIDAADQAGNGVQLRDMPTGVVTSLDTDKAFYERLSFTEEGDALIGLKGHDEITAWKDRLYAVIGWTGFVGSGAPKKVMYDPQKDTTFPKEMSINASRTPTWTEDRSAILFGINKINKADAPAGRGRGAAAEGADAPAAPAAPPAAAGDAADRPNLVIWHFKDPRLQSAQQVQEPQDRAYTYLSTYRVADNKFVRLANDEVRNIVVGAKEKFAIGTDNRAYELQGNLDGRAFRDVYAVNMTTGARTPIMKQARYGYQISPDGTKYYYYDAKHYFVFDLATTTAKNITQTVPTSFVDVEDDHNNPNPPINPVGWTADSKFLILSDAWDMWKVPVDGTGTAVNLTVNGKKNQIRYRQRLRVDPEEKGIDLSKTQYIGMMAEWTKKQGIGVLSPGGAGVELLINDDAAFGGLTKAKKADVWIYSKQTSSTAPEIFATNATLSTSRKLTNANAEVLPYLYTPGRILVDFYNDKRDKAQPKGEKLQGTLYLPANYEKGKTYPTIVYIYERLTQGTNNFSRPGVPGTGFNRAFYMSNGYAVFEPDIKYYVNDPGMSAVWALVPAVKAAIATGIVDPTRVALHGHSWGGYQTAFTITQTDIFKAAAAGAPLTDMISMYGLLYKNSGGTNGSIFEASQGRFTSGPWDNWEAYTRNSPIAFAKNVKTPLLMLHNDADGAVDFTQGIEYYNTLRRLGKPVVLIEYPGENHGLARQPNMQDYMIRMKEFFDYHLMSAPAPAWLETGVPRLKMNDDVTERLKAREEAKKKKGSGGTDKKGGV